VFRMTSIFTLFEDEELPSTPDAIAESVSLPAGNDVVVRFQNQVEFAVVVATAFVPLYMVICASGLEVPLMTILP
jgi:hypothetical protein